MARTVIITDDLTGEAGAKTRRIVLDGVEYEVDLTNASFAELKKALKPYLKNARLTNAARRATEPKARKATGAKRGRKASASPSTAAREWAIANGIAVPKRGRVPASVIAAFEAAK